MKTLFCLFLIIFLVLSYSKIIKTRMSQDAHRRSVYTTMSDWTCNRKQQSRLTASISIYISRRKPFIIITCIICYFLYKIFQEQKHFVSSPGTDTILENCNSVFLVLISVPVWVIQKKICSLNICTQLFTKLKTVIKV